MAIQLVDQSRARPSKQRVNSLANQLAAPHRVPCALAPQLAVAGPPGSSTSIAWQERRPGTAGLARKASLRRADYAYSLDKRIRQTFHFSGQNSTTQLYTYN